MSRGRRGGRKNRAEGAVAHGGFDAAKITNRRGYVYWPNLDTSKELTGGDRLMILRKARKMYADVGLARRIVNGVANLVGYLTPQADTPDREFNRRAEELFYERTSNAGVFDRAGKLNFHAWQIALTRLRLKDGDSLSVLTETQGGTARIILYEAHQIDNGNNDAPNLMDGVFVDRFKRHVGYHILESLESGIGSRVNALDAIFHADFERPHQTRGISALAHAINHMQDTAEILADVKHGIKMANQVGLQRISKSAVSGPQGFASAVTPVKRADGTYINVEQMREGGIVAELDLGEELKPIHDARPHPNQMLLLEWLVRDIAWGVGLSPEVLWDLSRQTGPSQRYLMAETRRWVEQEQQRLKVACQRFWTYFVAKAVKNGDLPNPPANWWWAEWIPQADQTIDVGREGRLELEQYKAGLLTLNEIASRKGKDWESMERQKAMEIQRRREIEQEFSLPAGALDGLDNKPENPQPNEQNENLV
jgi:capsid protein